jgi:hypothetical protein
MGAPNIQICASDVLVGVEAISAPNGGDARDGRDRLPIAQRGGKRGSLSVFALEAQLGPLVSGQPVRRRGGTRARSPAGSPYSRVDRPPPAAWEGK